MNSRLVCALALAGICAVTSSLAAAAPRGAKAIFDSGEGTTIAMSGGRAPSAPARPAAVAAAPQPYVGISYELMQVGGDGYMRPVSRSRVFRNGERVKLIVRTNRPGYLTVLNIGPTGNTNVIYNEYVEPYRAVDVPRGTNLMFVGAPGTERLLFMLSNEPNPMAPQSGGMVAANNPYPPGGMQQGGMPGGYPTPQQPNMPGAMGQPIGDPNAQQPQMPQQPQQPGTGDPNVALTSFVDAVNRTGGSKDLVAEDGMQSRYRVMSGRGGYQSVGVKDLVLESQGGVNYGVVPASVVANGGILTLDVALRHQ